MNYLIVGAGAIGTYIGASLMDAGMQVSFLERIEFADHLREFGVRLKLPSREILHPEVNVFSNPEDAFRQYYDVVVFAMKSFDTKAASESLYPYQGQIATILCLQNGVENENLIQSILQNVTVTAGSVTSAISRIGAGQVALEKMRGIGIEATQEIGRKIFEDFQKAGLNPKLYPSRADMKWSKMLSNLLGNATCAILDMTPAEVFSDPELLHLEMLQMKEALRVMKAYGWKAVDLPATPIGLLCGLIQILPEWMLRPILAKVVGAGRGKKMPSFHIDLHSGSQNSEVDFLNGAVSRFGISKEISTPVNDKLTRVLGSLVQNRDQIANFRHNKISLLHEILRKE